MQLKIGPLSDVHLYISYLTNPYMNVNKLSSFQRFVEITQKEHLIKFEDNLQNYQNSDVGELITAKISVTDRITL